MRIVSGRKPLWTTSKFMFTLQKFLEEDSWVSFQSSARKKERGYSIFGAKTKTRFVNVQKWTSTFIERKRLLILCHVFFLRTDKPLHKTICFSLTRIKKYIMLECSQLPESFSRPEIETNHNLFHSFLRVLYFSDLNTCGWVCVRNVLLDRYGTFFTFSYVPASWSSSRTIFFP